MKIFHNQIIGFNYRGRVYQWNKYEAVFTPNSSIPINYPEKFCYVPNEAKNIRLSVWETLHP